MLWILYHDADRRETVLFETDELTEATFILRDVVDNADAQLIDFSYDLDGQLDYVLAGVTLTDAVTETAA